ncbi:MAG TPA: cyclopropane-fatty-acyl-phospholipid synthase family protein [Solirubrobacteraceae bacterium]|nr:cyclopropane-fatty-acyl-phospholipid synthase family protein [Solirubrobacteraceae bacterium]
MRRRPAQVVVDLVLRRIRAGRLVLVEDERRRSYGSGTPIATVVVRSPRLWRMLLRGSLGLADAYAQGLWESPDLVALIRLGARNAAAMDEIRRRLRPLLRPIQVARALQRPTSRRRRRRDIAAHYDLGQELFGRMLDPTLTYSCAVFDDPDASLEQAQRNKLQLVCEKLDLGSGDRVLEIGSGWGSFALHAATTYDCHVTTTTISREQHDYVSKLVREAGLNDRITVLSKDYRDLTGRYDKLVSIEMIEAVGWRHTGSFLGACSRLLEPDGAMLLQAITIDDRAYEVEKASRSFMKERIFPGGALPSLAAIASGLARHTDLQLIGLQDLTPNYVPTLRRWRERFLAQAEELATAGYDEAFQRLWTLYLAYCEAGFAERRICDVQLVLAKPASRLSGLRHSGGLARPARGSGAGIA